MAKICLFCLRLVGQIFIVSQEVVRKLSLTEACISDQWLIPLNIGQSLQMVMGPTEAYWPSASSRKKSGRPSNANISVYGTRNAPAEQSTKQSCTIQKKTATKVFWSVACKNMCRPTLLCLNPALLFFILDFSFFTLFMWINFSLDSINVNFCKQFCQDL